MHQILVGCSTIIPSWSRLHWFIIRWFVLWAPDMQDKSFFTSFRPTGKTLERLPWRWPQQQPFLGDPLAYYHLLRLPSIPWGWKTWSSPGMCLGWGSREVKTVGNQGRSTPVLVSYDCVKNHPSTLSYTSMIYYCSEFCEWAGVCCAIFCSMLCSSGHSCGCIQLGAQQGQEYIGYPPHPPEFLIPFHSLVWLLYSRATGLQEKVSGSFQFFYSFSSDIPEHRLWCYLLVKASSKASQDSWIQTLLLDMRGAFT